MMMHHETSQGCPTGSVKQCLREETIRGLFTTSGAVIWTLKLNTDMAAYSCWSSTGHAKLNDTNMATICDRGAAPEDVQ
jgi:hypothetical protein